jgi:hypothetical protein
MASDSKAEKFVELATNRTRNAIKSIRLIGNLANRNNYHYTDEQTAAIIKRLKTEVKLLQQKFDEGGRKKDEIDFTL